MSELRFTNHEVAERYYSALREARITHMSWAMGTIVSEENIEEILDTVREVTDMLKESRKKEHSESEE